jgi:hypothetical protein
MMTEVQLSLPKRFEKLDSLAKASRVDLAKIVQKVPEVIDRLKIITSDIKTSGIGRLEIIYGQSGAGKTTFLRTLHQFIDGVEVTEISDETPLEEIPKIIKEEYTDSNFRIYALYDRENHRISKNETDERSFFENLRKLFRKDHGNILIVWPVSTEPVAKKLAEIAWEIGQDSVLYKAGEYYQFDGIARNKYYDVANLTVCSLLPGRNLETFLINQDDDRKIGNKPKTLSQYYTELESMSNTKTGHYKDVLKEKSIPKLWILLGGNSAKDLNITISSLTQGTKNQIDKDRLLQILDGEDSDQVYLNEWQKRRGEVAFLLDLFDVRLMPITPNILVKCTTAFADDAFLAKVKLKRGRPADAIAAIKKSPFYRGIADAHFQSNSVLRKEDAKTNSAYMAIQKNARSDDKKMNKFLSEAIKKAFEKDGISVSVTAESIIPNGSIIPDINIKLGDDVFCLEPTWRQNGSSDKKTSKEQSTMTPGHIQMYVMKKLLDYVKDIVDQKRKKADLKVAKPNPKRR